MNKPREVEVLAEDDGQRLDRWLKKRAPEIPYALIQKLIRVGAVKINGKKAKTDTRVYEGQTIRVPTVEDRGTDAPKKQKPLTQDDETLIKSMVIYDDGDIFALNKPGNIASQGGGGVEKHIDGLLELMADKKGRRPRLIHRLDRDTSGVLLCARTSESVRQLGFAFRDRNAQKIYWAIVMPAPEDEEGTINAPLVKGTGAMKDRMIVDEHHEEAKVAVTDFIVLERAARKAAFVAFLPRTGRTHQIRVHAADVLGCPILNDGKYGKGQAVMEGEVTSTRLHLHARKLTLHHPHTKKILELVAPVPDDIASTWKALDFDMDAADHAVSGSIRKE